jgi:hypothetical protein
LIDPKKIKFERMAIEKRFARKPVRFIVEYNFVQFKMKYTSLDFCECVSRSSGTHFAKNIIVRF